MQNVHDNISHTIQSNTIDILLIYDMKLHVE